MANRVATFVPVVVMLILLASATTPISAQGCVSSQDPPESGQIEASFLSMGTFGGKPVMYLDKGGRLYQLECPQCPALVFGDRLSIEYSSLMQCLRFHQGVTIKFTKIGSDPNAGQEVIQGMQGIVTEVFQGGFRYKPIRKDKTIGGWTFDVPDPSIMASVESGSMIRLRMLSLGCTGLPVRYCSGVALSLEKLAPPAPPPVPRVSQPPPQAAQIPQPLPTQTPTTNITAIVWSVIGLSVLLLAILIFLGTRSQKSQPTHLLDPPVLAPALVTTHEGDLILAKEPTDLQAWDETAITRQLESMRGQSPAVVSHYIDSVKKRIVLNQNDKTALAQVKFLQTKVQELKLFKEGREIVIDLEAMVLEREKRLKTLQLENAQLDRQMVTHSQRDHLAALKEQRQMELEIAQIERQIADLNKPTTATEARSTPEQQRANDRAASEARIQSLKSEKQNALKLEDEQERILKVNAIDDALQREMERWAKLL